MKQLLIILALFTTVAIATDSRAETNTVSSTVVTNSTPPTANAPSIMNTNSDICKVGIGGSVQNNVLGVATGILIDDELCQKLKLLCQDPRVHDSMQNAGTPCPVNGLIGAEAAAYWKDNPEKIPEGSQYRKDYIQVKKQETKEFSDASSIALYKALFLITTGLLLF